MEGVIEDNSNYDEMLNDKLYLQKLGMRQLTTHPSATSIPDETPFTDYLSTGQTVGEVAFLTSVKRSAVARCDTSVQLYHVLYEAVQVRSVCMKHRGALNFGWCKLRIVIRQHLSLLCFLHRLFE